MSSTAVSGRSDSGPRPGSAGLDPEADTLLAESRERRPLGLARSERFASILTGGSFLAAAAAFAVVVDSSRHPSPATILLLLATYAVAAKVEFEIGAGFAVPTELVLVPMIFLVPIDQVPLLVAAGLVIGELTLRRSRREHLERLIVVPGNAWHAVGPALVLAVAGERSPSWSAIPVLLAALAAQMAFDYASSALREWIAFRLRPLSQLRFMGWVWMVDAALAPIGLAVAFAAPNGVRAAVLVLPLVGLLAVFARQRRVGIDRALELSHAYRGTAFLLGDVVEADDSYTGAHCRDV